MKTVKIFDEDKNKEVQINVPSFLYEDRGRLHSGSFADGDVTGSWLDYLEGLRELEENDKKEKDSTPAIKVTLVVDTIKSMVKAGITTEIIAGWLNISLKEVMVVVDEEPSLPEVSWESNYVRAYDNEAGDTVGRFRTEQLYNVYKLPQNLRKYWTEKQKDYIKNNHYIKNAPLNPQLIYGDELLEQLVHNGASFEEIASAFKDTKEGIEIICRQMKLI